ncbi:uncharacterized protein L203_102434 [Cryptococcus depauperatus CBS 7841]|uniref:Derlin n=1 Tax=Cryptococcus depauperatus CBS 7841 TaxID=1295531 RepID=A0A1E3HH20_9TREE|nr:derlin-2/3 [Cryptococcus depauperatus CBS 7841]
MSDLSTLFRSVPPVTRTLLLGMAIVTVPCLLGILSPSTVTLSWRRTLRSFELWRPITCFFFGGSGFPLLYDFFLIFRNSSSMETEVYSGDTAEYAWLHLMLGVFLLFFNLLFDLPFLFRSLLHAQTYVWCRANPNVKVSIFGLLTIPTSLYPISLIVLDLLTGGPLKAIAGVMGLLAGHLWWFIATYLPVYAPPQLRRQNPLSTPSFFRAFLSNERAATISVRKLSQARSQDISSSKSPAAQESVRHRWGGGQKLGGSSL